MNTIGSQPGDETVHVMLPMRLTEGIVVLRTHLDNAPAIATNVPPLRHSSRTGFDFGNDGAGASDLALACVHAVLTRMDYVGPVEKLWDGNRVYRLAMELHAPFRAHFIESAQGDELRIPWSQALGWTRRTLLSLVRERGLTQASLLKEWQRSLDALPDPLPQNELDLATLNRQLRDDLIEMTGDVSVLSQFLGMIA